MSRYQAYAEYKDSGVEWLGDVPAHWSVSKVKYLTEFQVGWTPPTKDDANFEGDNLWANISDLKEREIYDTNKKISDHAAKVASMEISPRGSLLYSFKLSVGAVSFAGKDMYTNEAIATFLPTSKLPLAYLYYVLPKYLIENASTNIYGARILNQELISNTALLAPTFTEAENIANFLDHETAKIDLLIEKQQALIELLKEKRQAVISHAVTKGLNPNAPMKDSGVEWLGEVPAHWNVLSLGKITLKKCDGPFGSGLKSEHYTENGVRVIRLQNIKLGSYFNGDSVYINEIYYENNLGDHDVVSGDILIAGLGDPNNPVGRACVAPQEIAPAMVKADCFRFRIDVKKSHPEFIAQQLSASSYFYAGTLSSGSTRMRIPLSQMATRKIAIGSLKEQVEILNKISELTKKFDEVEQVAEAAISLMQERRTALISAAVTGKIDVRDWQKPAQA